MMTYVLLAAGIGLLVLAGDALVRGAVALALKLGIPVLIIGLTIVAFGTSAPELVVSVQAALTDLPGIALGNVVGSNIANVLLVLGVPALIVATDTKELHLARNTLYMIAASLLFIGFCMTGTLERWHGALMLGLLVAFLAQQVLHYRQHRQEAALIAEDTAEQVHEDGEHPKSNLHIALLILAGLIGLPIAAHLTVDSAAEIARRFNISDEVIGLTLVAVGTSLPEFAATLMAAMRNHVGIALGNVIGSNLFNLLGVMGVTAILKPVPVAAGFLTFDLWIMLIASLALLPFVLDGRRITRGPALTFVLAYAIYIFAVYTPQAVGPTAMDAAATLTGRAQR